MKLQYLVISGWAFAISACIFLPGCSEQKDSSEKHSHQAEIHTSPKTDSGSQQIKISDYLKKYETIMESMHRGMADVKPGEDDNINFLKQMIPHHQGAVDMSEAILKSSTDRRIINLARGIITEQKYEIALMQTLIAEIENKKEKTH